MLKALAGVIDAVCFLAGAVSLQATLRRVVRRQVGGLLAARPRAKQALKITVKCIEERMNALDVVGRQGQAAVNLIKVVGGRTDLNGEIADIFNHRGDEALSSAMATKERKKPELFLMTEHADTFGVERLLAGATWSGGRGDNLLDELFFDW